jgi:hypothetical protein
VAPTPLLKFSSTSFGERTRDAVAHSGTAPYLPAMSGERVHPRSPERSPIFSRAEIYWLWAIVLAAVLVSTVAGLVSDRTIADLLGAGPSP